VTQDVSIPRLGFAAAQLAIAWLLDQQGGAPAVGSRWLKIRLDDEARAAIAALPKDRRYVTPPFAPD
jgi:2,5-diketo-D-gluconate reductase B